MSILFRPDGLWPMRLLCPWHFPGKNTGVGCRFLLQCMKVKVKSFSRVQILETPWTAAYQAPPSMGFSRQEYWSGVPLPSPKQHIVGFKKIHSIQNALIINLFWSELMIYLSTILLSVVYFYVLFTVLNFLWINQMFYIISFSFHWITL